MALAAAPGLVRLQSHALRATAQALEGQLGCEGARELWQESPRVLLLPASVLQGQLGLSGHELRVLLPCTLSATDFSAHGN